MILAPSSILHSPVSIKEDVSYYKVTPNSRSSSSSYFPPASLSYYPPRAVYPLLGPALPPPPSYMYRPYYHHNPPDMPQDIPEDRIDTTSVSLVSLLPALLMSVLVPVLAAGSAVWLSQNLPTPVVQERKKRNSDIDLGNRSACI